MIDKAKFEEWFDSYNLVFFMLLVSFGWIASWVVVIILAVLFL